MKLLRSLRARLQVALLLVLSLFLGLWLISQNMMLKREQTGWCDSSMRMMAHQIVLSLPSNLDQLAIDRAKTAYRLPAGLTTTDGRVERSSKLEKADFQIWTSQGGVVSRSPDSPKTPLRADFVDGFADTEVDGQLWRVYSVSDDKGRIHVQVGRTHAQLQAEFAHWVKASVTGAVVVFALLGTVIWFVICWSLRPVTAVQEAIRKRHALDLSPLPSSHLPNEVAPMVESFNQLLQRLDGSLQGERRFIADAAHELRTPLAALLAHAELALAARDADQSRASLARLVEGVQRSARLAEQLLDLARLDAGSRLASPRRIGLYEVVEVVVRDFELTAQQRRQRLVLELEVCEVIGDVDMLGILVRNLIDNALRYGGEGGRVRVSCENRGHEVLLSVADDGPGVPREEHARIFDRFYRVPGRAGRGSGVGLSLVARIADLHGARIATGAGLDGRGFSVSLHFAAPPATAAVAPARPSLITGVLRADRPLT